MELQCKLNRNRTGLHSSFAFSVSNAPWPHLFLPVGTGNGSNALKLARNYGEELISFISKRALSIKSVEQEIITHRPVEKKIQSSSALLFYQIE